MQSDGVKNEIPTDLPPPHQAPAVSKVAWLVTFLFFEHFMFLYEAAFVTRVPRNIRHNIPGIR